MCMTVTVDKASSWRSEAFCCNTQTLPFLRSRSHYDDPLFDPDATLATLMSDSGYFNSSIRPDPMLRRARTPRDDPVRSWSLRHEYPSLRLGDESLDPEPGDYSYPSEYATQPLWGHRARRPPDDACRHLRGERGADYPLHPGTRPRVNRHRSDMCGSEVCAGVACNLCGKEVFL